LHVRFVFKQQIYSHALSQVKHFQLSLDLRRFSSSYRVLQVLLTADQWHFLLSKGIPRKEKGGNNYPANFWLVTRKIGQQAKKLRGSIQEDLEWLTSKILLSLTHIMWFLQA
jgi:hypothetical protein